MKKIALVLGFILIVSSATFAETINVAGSGGMITLLTALAKAYMAKNPGDTVNVWQNSIEAKGGIIGAYEGKIDIGMSARYLTPDETALGLSSFEIARVASVIAVNNSVSIKSITSSQLCGIYSGEIQNWKQLGGNDKPIKAFTRPDADSTKLTIRKGIKCFENLKEGPHVISMPKALNMYNALMNNPDSIGFVDMVAIDQAGGKLTALILDGIEPSEKNVISEKWPIIKHYVLVTKGMPKGLSKKFIDFIKEAEAKKIIMEHSAIPVK